MLKESTTFSADSVTCHTRLNLLGTLPYYLLPVKRATIKHNISLVFGDLLSKKEVTRLTKIVYGNLIQVACEVFCNTFRSRAQRTASLEVQNFDRVEKALALGKGVLWMGCHLGNWESGIVNLMHRHPEMQGRTTVIRKQLRPPWINSLVTEHFRSSGIDVLSPDASSIKKILQRLRKNEAVVVVLDQHTSIEGATVTNFFGHKAQITKSLARLALLTKAPVVPIFMWTERNGQHVCHFSEVIPTVAGVDRTESISKTTQAYTDALETVITQFPEQWFCWLHRLWKASVKYEKGNPVGGLLVRFFRRLRLI